jgi:CMP-N-acetylneuraminic acid synthetase
VGGKPLLAWTVEEACKSSLLDAVVMTTDDAEIAEAARRYGASVPFMRPAWLAGDATPHIDCVLSPAIHTISTT